jgi:hypothetical protein
MLLVKFALGTAVLVRFQTCTFQTNPSSIIDSQFRRRGEEKKTFTIGYLVYKRVDMSEMKITFALTTFSLILYNFQGMTQHSV